ncbi:MAG: hypothetical protein ABIQ30_15840 [Devosia sp.]
MNASTLNATPNASYFGGLPGLFHVTSVITILTGMTLHASRLPLGPEAFQHDLFTPVVDILFAVPMTIAGIAMVLLWRRAILRTLWEKIAYGFVALFMVGSLILHAKTVITWDTSYVNFFPDWYPYVAVVYLGLIGIFCATRRFIPARIK